MHKLLKNILHTQYTLYRYSTTQSSTDIDSEIISQKVVSFLGKLKSLNIILITVISIS